MTMQCLAGFAGATADAFTLFEKFEANWRSIAAISPGPPWNWRKTGGPIGCLRRLEALLAVADLDHSFIISGTGDVVEPEDGILAIGSGGPYALAAARALLAHSELGAEQIVRESHDDRRWDRHLYQSTDCDRIALHRIHSL